MRTTADQFKLVSQRNICNYDLQPNIEYLFEFRQMTNKIEFFEKHSTYSDVYNKVLWSFMLSFL